MQDDPLGHLNQNERSFLDKLTSMREPLTSEDLKDLRPSTAREHLMILLPIQRSVMQRLEGIEEILTKGDGLVGRVGKLETTWKIGGTILVFILTAMIAACIKMLFG